jgi:DNA-binding transcriptional regulator YhcF (GntR family)
MKMIEQQTTSKSDGKCDETQHSVTKGLRDHQIIAKRLGGESTSAIAAEMGISRATVSRALNGEEARALVVEAENGLKLLLSKAVGTIEEALDGPDMNNALKAALVVLKAAGLLETSARAETVTQERAYEQLTDEQLSEKLQAAIRRYTDDKAN